MAQFVKNHKIFKIGNKRNKEINVHLDTYDDFVEHYNAIVTAAKLLNSRSRITRTHDHINVYFFINESNNDREVIIRINVNKNFTIKNIAVVLDYLRKERNKGLENDFLKSLTYARMLVLGLPKEKILELIEGA